MAVAITGATGQLGNLVIKHLLNKLPSTQIIAIYNQVGTGDWAKRSDDLKMRIDKEVPLKDTVQKVLNL